MMTILVSSFDGYSDLWQPFFDIFKRQWPDCPYEIKLISNYLKMQGVETITTGEEISWTDRMLKATDSVETNYILLLLEDYFFGKEISNADINNALSFLKKRNGNYLRLTNIPPCKNGRNAFFENIYSDQEYGINLQASIWKKSFLVDSLKRYSGSAWEFEIGFLKEAVLAKHETMQGCFALKKDPLCIHNGVLKGKWFPKEIRYFEKSGFSIPWKKRGKLGFWRVTKYNLTIWLKNHISYKSRKRLKAFLRKIGFRFVSDF